MNYLAMIPRSLTLGLSLVLASCASNPVVLSELRAPTSTESAKEREILSNVNSYRQANSKRRLKADRNLSDLARLHSQRMARGETDFGHDGFGFRFSHARNLLEYDSLGELVGYSTRSDATPWILKQWKGSSVHRKQMLGSGQFAGAGVARSASGTTYATFVMAVKADPIEVKGPKVLMDGFGNLR